ncbi:5-azacytidine-induced protein 1, partial [Operophtera brumata]
RNYEAEQQLTLKKKVTEIAAQHKIERDREIEKAIENMDAEAQAGRKELQDAIRQPLSRRRNKEQYEGELKELAETEQATLRRYQEAQARIRQTEDKSRADEVRTSCEEAWRGKVDALRKEMEDMRKTHDEQMHQLYAKESAKNQEKILMLEQKLQQQRKDFLKHKLELLVVDDYDGCIG